MSLWNFAVVTGGGAGIGRACCARLAEEGARVVVTDVSEERGRETVSQIEGTGGEGFFRTPYSGITPEDRTPKGVPSFMAYMHAIAAGHLEWAVYAVSLLAGALPDDLLAIIRMRGFGRRGFGGRGFGRGLGPFRLIRLIRLLFVLLFTTVLGPVVLVALVAFVAYWFFTSRRGR